MKKNIGVGIVGYGKVGSRSHRNWINERDDATLVAVSDITEVRRKAAEEDNPGIRIYEDYLQFLSDSDVDLVIITTPPNTHCNLTIQACSAGKHVFVDKPFAMTAAEADRMLSAADKAGVVIHCHQSRRYDGEYQSILACVSKGRIGRITHIRRVWSQYGDEWANWGIEGFNPSWRVQKQYGGGMVYDYAPHCGDQILVLVGGALKQVYSDVRGIKFSAEVDDHFACMMRFAGGTTAYLEASNMTRIPSPHWYVVGTKGCITAEKVGGPIQVLADGMAEPETLQPVEIRSELYDNLIRACRGETKPNVTPKQLMTTMKLIDAIFASSASRSIVDID